MKRARLTNTKIDGLAYDQVLLNLANETEMDAEFAALLQGFVYRSEVVAFKHAYRRHAANAAAGNPFYF